MQNCHTEAAQTLVNLEALGKRVGVAEGIGPSWIERSKGRYSKTNEEISAIWGNWEVATIKLQGLDSEVEKVRPQLHTTNQELTTKMTDETERTGGKGGNNVGGNTNNTARVGHHHGEIQNHLMRDGDPDETSNVEETPAISESIPPQAGPSGEIEEPTMLSRASFQADLEKQL